MFCSQRHPSESQEVASASLLQFLPLGQECKISSKLRGWGSRRGHHPATAKSLVYDKKCYSLPFSSPSISLLQPLPAKSQKRAEQEAGTEALGSTFTASQRAVRSTSRMLRAKAEGSRTARCASQGCGFHLLLLAQYRKSQKIPF